MKTYPLPEFGRTRYFSWKNKSREVTLIELDGQPFQFTVRDFARRKTIKEVLWFDFGYLYFLSRIYGILEKARKFTNGRYEVDL